MVSGDYGKLHLQGSVPSVLDLHHLYRFFVSPAKRMTNPITRGYRVCLHQF